MKKFLEYGIYAVIFLLPWQTVWIIQEAMIGPEGAMGVWQYGTLKIYAIEFLILALTSVFIFCVCTARGIPSRDRQTPQRGGCLSARLLFLLRRKPCPLTPHIAQRNTPRILFSSVSVFLLFAGVSIFWGADKLVALFAWVRLLEGAFLFFLIRSIPVRWNLMCGVWIAAAVIQSALGIWQFAVQEVVAHKFLGIAAHHPLTLGDAVVEAGDRRWLRAYGAFPHPNMLGAYLAVGMVMCATVLVRAKEKWQWLFLLVASQIILIALLLTFSRSAWLALGVATLIGGALSFPRSLLSFRSLGGTRDKLRRESRKIIAHPVIALIFVCVITIGAFSTFFSEEVAARLGITSSRLEEQSLSERVSILDRALNSIPFITWITGTGIGNFTNTLFHYEEEQSTPQPWYAYQPIHNAFLMIFAELGIIGIALFLALLSMIVRTLYYFSSRVMGYLPTGQAGGLLVALLVPAFFDHFLWTLPVGVLFASVTLGILWKRFS